ncbi:MAG: RNA-binding protein [Pseudomonadota bacterium]
MAAEQHIDDGPRRRARTAPERACAVTRVAATTDDLIRFVRAPDGTVTPDLKAKLPGRGVWIGARHALIDTAVRKRAFSRGFKMDALAAESLADEVGALLQRSAVQALAMATKAGAVVTGFDSVARAIETGGLTALVQACDAAEDGRSKLSRRFVAERAANARTALEIAALTIDELSLATGRANVVHAGLTESRATSAFVQAAQRYARYRTDAPIGPTAVTFDETEAETAETGGEPQVEHKV